VIERLAKLLGRLVAIRAVFGSAHVRRGRGVHAPRPSQDQDPSERRVPSNRRAETIVAVLLLLAAALAFAFTAVYVAASTNTQLLGVTIGGALAMLAAALIVAGKLVVRQETAVQERDALLDEEQTEEVVELIESGGEGVSRRVLLTGAGGLAGAALVTAAAAPLASLGPRLTGIHDTPWHAGVRLIDELGQPYLANEIQTGTFYTALPEGGDAESFGAGLLVVRLPAQMIDLPPARQGWAPDGILAYSKICTHAGCAISLYRYPTYGPTSGLEPAFTCPCHYSTFSPGEAGKVLFGPAGRPLPQLPLMIDSSGHLRAAGGFDEDIGPSWFDVHRA
jgi:ubiquinol-cytochrome c reductase iron-sulfur subunit